jgi:hypothetical protein
LPSKALRFNQADDRDDKLPQPAERAARAIGYLDNVADAGALVAKSDAACTKAEDLTAHDGDRDNEAE